MQKRMASVHSKFDQASDEIFKTYKKQDTKAFTNILIKHVEAGLNILGISSSDRFRVVCKQPVNLCDMYNCCVYRTIDCTEDDPALQQNPPLPYLNITVRRSLYGVELVASGDVNHLRTEDIDRSKEERDCLPKFTSTVFAELGKVSNTELSRKDLINIMNYLKLAFKTYHYDQCQIVPAEQDEHKNYLASLPEEFPERPKIIGCRQSKDKTWTAEIEGV
jgi:hypothetical protein